MTYGIELARVHNHAIPRVTIRLTMGETIDFDWHEFHWDDAPKMPPGQHKAIKLLADANVPKPLIDELRAAGLKVDSVVEMRLGRHPDENVSQLARRLKRIILTMDGDFWDERKHPIQQCSGVIFVDIPPDRVEVAVDGLARFYALFAKYYPLEWWERTKARVTERGFSLRMRTWEGRVSEDTFRLTNEGRLLTKRIR